MGNITSVENSYILHNREKHKNQQLPKMDQKSTLAMAFLPVLALILSTFSISALPTQIRYAKWDEHSNLMPIGANGYYQQPRVQQMPSSSSGFTTRYFGYQPQLPYQNEKAAAASFLSQFMQPEESSMAKRDGVIRGFLVQRSNPSIESDS